VLVHLGFGGDQGPGTAQNILVSDANDASFFLLENLKSLMTRFESAWFAGSPRSMVDLGDRQLKRIVHFKLFVAVEGLSQTIEKGIQPGSSFSPFTSA